MTFVFFRIYSRYFAFDFCVFAHLFFCVFSPLTFVFFAFIRVISHLTFAFFRLYLRFYRLSSSSTKSCISGISFQCQMNNHVYETQSFVTKCYLSALSGWIKERIIKPMSKIDVCQTLMPLSTYEGLTLTFDLLT